MMLYTGGLKRTATGSPTPRARVYLTRPLDNEAELDQPFMEIVWAVQVEAMRKEEEGEKQNLFPPYFSRPAVKQLILPF